MNNFSTERVVKSAKFDLNFRPQSHFSHI